MTVFVETVSAAQGQQSDSRGVLTGQVARQAGV